MPGQRRRGTRIDFTSPTVTPEAPSQTVIVEDGPGPMSRSVAEALKTAPTLPRDDGAVALAERYAALIDAAEPSAVYARHLRVLRGALTGVDDTVMEVFIKVAEALSAHSVASDLGPKLLATLTALGMTAAGRSAKGGAPDGPKVPDELGALRARARDRGTR